jgi:hypothetical protein
MNLSPFTANAHLHLPPNFSAFETVEQAVELAEAENVRVLGASNYYDYHVYGEFAQRCRQKGIAPLFGIEIIAKIDALMDAGIKINDPGNPGKMYICGKGITEFEVLNRKAQILLNIIRGNDGERMAGMTAKLAEVFTEAGLETELDEEAVKKQIVARHGSPMETVYLQERHIAQAFQEAVFERVPAEQRTEFWTRLFGVAPKSAPDDAVGLQNEIRSHLMKAGKPAYLPETFVSFEQAFRLILALGGIPCYPVLADGASPFCAYEAVPDALVPATQARNIHAAEFIPIRNSPEVLTRYVTAFRNAGFVVTAGTEHNTRDLLPITPTCVNGEPIPESINAIFREGACVVLAHQHLRQKGEMGFIDENGEPNPNYPDADSRIAAFAEMGAALLRGK